jgi:phosphoribosylpyrophosphate synthetase
MSPLSGSTARCKRGLHSSRGRSHFAGGNVSEMAYQPGDTRHHTYAAGEFMIHDLENIGDTDMVFTTVEFLDSANALLWCMEAVKRGAARVS